MLNPVIEKLGGQVNAWSIVNKRCHTLVSGTLMYLPCQDSSAAVRTAVVRTIAFEWS